MNKKYLVGIDVGTTGSKVMAFDIKGKVVAQAYMEYNCTYPKANWVEQDPIMLIETVYELCEKIMKEDSIRADEIIGISVASQRSCTIFMDEQETPLKMISWLDNRAGEQVEEIDKKISKERFYEITGLPLCTTWILPKILHTRKYDSELWSKTKKVIQLQDLIIKAMGVKGYYSDEPEGGFYGVWDNENFCYSDEILEKFNLSKDLFPEMKRSGENVGAVSAYVAERTGFLEGTPICVGIGDQNGAAIGAGIVKPGYISVSIGTGGLATALLDTCYRDPLGGAMITNHGIHGRWTFEGLQNAAAGAFRWFRDEIAALEKDRYDSETYDILNKMIEKSPVGANGLLMLPYLAGSAAPRWNPSARGGFLGLTLSHDRATMARACVEGITLEQKDIMKSITKNGPKFEAVRIVGGATKSEIWNQIQADVYNLPCETLVIKDAAVLGAAICAGVGTGTFASIEEGVASMVEVSKRYEPNEENAKKYEEMYEIYCDVYNALDKIEVFKRLEKL